MKTNKSVSKRMRVTKRGKIVVRTPGHNHFNAKRSGGEIRANGRSATIEMTQTNRSRFLPRSN